MVSVCNWTTRKGDALRTCYAPALVVLDELLQAEELLELGFMLRDVIWPEILHGSAGFRNDSQEI